MIERKSHQIPFTVIMLKYRKVNEEILLGIGIRGTKMNFNEFKNKYFAGDTNKALEKLVEERINNSYELTVDKNGFREIFDSMDKKSARVYNKLARRNVLEENKDAIEQAILLYMILDQINMSDEDVIKSKKNPFVKKTILGLLFLFGGIILFPAIYFMLNGIGINIEGMFTISGVISSSLIGLGSLSITNSILKISKFKKAKRMLMALEEKTDDNINSRLKPEIGNDEKTSVKSNDNNQNDDANNGDTLPLYKDVKDEVTLSELLDILNKKYKSKRTMGLVCGIVIPIALSGMVAFMSLKVALIGLACGLPLFVYGIYSQIVLKKINKLNFYIKTEKCVSKERKVDEDVNVSDGLYLFFSEGGKYKIDYSHEGVLFESLKQGLEYESAYVGREFYTLYIGRSKKKSLCDTCR